MKKHVEENANSTAGQGPAHSHTTSMTARTEPAFNPKSFLAEFGKGKTHTDHRKGHKIFSQGDAAAAIFYLQKGKIKLTVISQQGKEAVIALLGDGDFFGEGCLAGQSLRTSTATALTACSITRVDKAETIRFLHGEPAFSGMILRYVLSRNIRIEEDLVDHLFNSSEKRLARVLLLLANFGKEGQPAATIAPISQETLAAIIGTTRSRVSFFMNRFRKHGFVHYDGHSRMEVHSSLLNVVLND